MIRRPPRPQAQRFKDEQARRVASRHRHFTDPLFLAHTGGNVGDKLVVVFDGDIFEDKVKGYDELITAIEEHDIAAVTNPSFELFLILHYEGSYEKHIKGHEQEFFQKLDSEKHGHAYSVLLELSGMNAKSNSEIGKLAAFCGPQRPSLRF